MSDLAVTVLVSAAVAVPGGWLGARLGIAYLTYRSNRANYRPRANREDTP